MKELFGTLVRGSGTGHLLRWLLRYRLTIIVYHDPAPDVMDRHLAWLGRYYAFVTLDEVERVLAGKRWHDLPAYPLLVTLDDGHANNRALAEVFRRHGVRPTIFLCSHVVGTERPFWWKTPAAAALGPTSLKRVPDARRRALLKEAGSDPDQPAPPRQALAWSEVMALGSVVSFGGHSRSHPILPLCDDTLCAQEIAGCRDDLEGALGMPCRHFAYPNGDWGERERALVKEAGFTLARSFRVGWNGPGTDPFALKAIPVTDHASVNWLAAQMTGLPGLVREIVSGERWRVRFDGGKP
ncbi:MAG TPA: polysaccharide deacetylase family protein [Azospirillaceae bacterium]|nr:polysaccharide deacetylase family protein [Azospirillaceae bacterium]